MVVSAGSGGQETATLPLVMLPSGPPPLVAGPFGGDAAEDVGVLTEASATVEGRVRAVLGVSP